MSPRTSSQVTLDRGGAARDQDGNGLEIVEQARPGASPSRSA